jgi:hypothetical protein
MPARYPMRKTAARDEYVTPKAIEKRNRAARSTRKITSKTKKLKNGGLFSLLYTPN